MSGKEKQPGESREPQHEPKTPARDPRGGFAYDHFKRAPPASEPSTDKPITGDGGAEIDDGNEITGDGGAEE